MEARRSYLIRERPLSPEDYELPIGWWGWNWEPPVPMSVTEIVGAGNMDARTAALCWMVVEAHGSVLIASEPPHSGKTTTLTAFLDFLPSATRRVFLRGWSETFDYLRHFEPARTLLLANELSSHLPVYLWGPKAVRVFRSLRDGFALASTLHADSAEEAISQLTGELGVAPEDLARVDLLLVMRMYRRGEHGAVARRVVSVDRLVEAGSGLRPLPLVEWDPRTDRHRHSEGAEMELLCRLRGGRLEDLQRELTSRTEHLAKLVELGVDGILPVRGSIARYRGETMTTTLSGEPTA